MTAEGDEKIREHGVCTLAVAALQASNVNDQILTAAISDMDEITRVTACFDEVGSGTTVWADLQERIKGVQEMIIQFLIRNF